MRAVSALGRFLATGGEDGGIKLWNLVNLIQGNANQASTAAEEEIVEIKTRMPLPNSQEVPPPIEDTKDNPQPKLSEKEKQQINQIKCIQLYSDTESGNSPCILAATTKGTLFRYTLTDDPEKLKRGIALFQDEHMQLISDIALTNSFRATDEGFRIMHTVLVIGNGDIVVLEIVCNGLQTTAKVVHK